MVSARFVWPTWVFLVALMALAACGPERIYEQGQALPNNTWQVDSLLRFEVKVENPTQAYDLFYRVRYDLDYPFYNLYVRLQIQDSAGAEVFAQRHELVLLDPTTGKPMGSGLGGVFEKEFTALQKIHFAKPGQYRVQVGQYMRQKALPGLHEFGIRISPSK
jgi:gliding motility-associated lipoprotein GldH